MQGHAEALKELQYSACGGWARTSTLYIGMCLVAEMLRRQAEQEYGAPPLRVSGGTVQLPEDNETWQHAETKTELALLQTPAQGNGPEMLVQLRKWPVGLQQVCAWTNAAWLRK